VSIEVRTAPLPGRDTEAYALRNPFRSGTIKEISADGIYLISGMRFNVNDTVELRLTLDGETYTFRAIARHTSLDTVSARPTMGVGAQVIRSDQAVAVMKILLERALRVKTTPT
jgi:hypothetical protein